MIERNADPEHSSSLVSHLVGEVVALADQSSSLLDALECGSYEIDWQALRAETRVDDALPLSKEAVALLTEVQHFFSEQRELPGPRPRSEVAAELLGEAAVVGARANHPAAQAR